MKVKSTRALRQYIKTYEAGDLDPRTNPDFIGSHHQSAATGVKGFFQIMHGIKPDIPGYLQPILKIAEDGQAVYEFIQNAVDCNSTQFWIFYDENYFLAVNNGDSFQPNEIISILNIAQSPKRNLEDSVRCSKIGRFGIGFKLVHRLVGENDGTSELTQLVNGELKGPVIFSWDHFNQLKSFITSPHPYTQVSEESLKTYTYSPWLFKILLTNFPVSPGEIVKDFNYNDFAPFPESEVEEMKSFVLRKLGEPLTNKLLLSKGSMFFIKLGKGKASRLKSEELSLQAGVNYSMSFFNKLERITLNQNVINKNKLFWLKYEIPKTTAEFEEINPEYSFCPIKIAVGYSNEIDKMLAIKEQPNFYKYFPLGDEVNKLGFLIHCDAFDIESNRRKIHSDICY